MKKKLSINDIANIANVSKSTVSRYLNDGHVKEATRTKISKIIEENKYEPNLFARLKAKDSKIIGVIAPCLDSDVTSQVLMEIDARLWKENYLSLFINTNHDTEEELRNMENLGHMNVAGIILNATQVSDKHAEIANRLSIPVVFVAQKCDEGISIVNEDYEAGNKMGDYVGETGHNDILIISVNPFDVAVGVDRVQGIMDALKRQGVSKIEVLESDFSLQHTYELLSNALDLHIPEIIICSTTKQLLGTYKCLRERNINIPEDISVVGFCVQETSELLVPKATTIQFCPKQTGKLSAQAMLSLLGDEVVEKVQHVTYEFIEGNSVKRGNNYENIMCYRRSIDRFYP